MQFAFAFCIALQLFGFILSWSYENHIPVELIEEYIDCIHFVNCSRLHNCDETNNCQGIL